MVLPFLDTPIHHPFSGSKRLTFPPPPLQGGATAKVQIIERVGEAGAQVSDQKAVFMGKVEK